MSETPVVETKATKPVSALKAIRLKCLDCSGQSQADVRDCVIPECVLYPYRMGKNPNRKGIGCKNPTHLHKK